MTHIAIACYASGSGGSVAAVAVRHARELAKYFERVTLVSNSFPDGLQENVGRGRVTPINFHFLRRFCHVPNEYAFVRAVKNYLESLYKKERIDMIMCHSHALAALSAKPLKDRYGIPFALVTHGDIFDRPKGTYDSRLTAFYKAVTPVAYRNADVIIALSPYMATCAEKGGENPKTIHVVPNGIDPADIGLAMEAHATQAERTHFNGPMKLLYVGGLSVPKGVDILLSACSILKKRGVPFSLKIIGEGNMHVQLKNMVEHMGLSEEIHFLGKIQRHLLGGYYQAADLVCVPSLSDPLPTVVLEALVSGTPVIGAAVGGIPFMIESGKNGIIVPPESPTAFADAIEDLYHKPGDLQTISRKALSSVFPRFSWEAIGKMLGDLIRETIHRDRN